MDGVRPRYTLPPTQWQISPWETSSNRTERQRSVTDTVFFLEEVISHRTKKQHVCQRTSRRVFGRVTFRPLHRRAPYDTMNNVSQAAHLHVYTQGNIENRPTGTTNISFWSRWNNNPMLQYIIADETTSSMSLQARMLCSDYSTGSARNFRLVTC